MFGVLGAIGKEAEFSFFCPYQTIPYRGPSDSLAGLYRDDNKMAGDAHVLGFRGCGARRNHLSKSIPAGGDRGASYRISGRWTSGSKRQVLRSILIAEKSSKLGDSELEDLLKRTDNAPVIQTQFIGGNSLTAEFYFPGRSQPRISIREIVQRRLQHLRSNQQP